MTSRCVEGLSEGHMGTSSASDTLFHLSLATSTTK